MLAGCGEKEHGPAFIADGNPPKLSDWGMFRLASGRLAPQARVVPYDLATPLFSDYAAKLRTLWMPEGQAARYDDSKAFDFPVGTVITKTFYYPKGQQGRLRRYESAAPLGADGGLDLATVRLVETRLLVRRDTGWQVFPYVWTDKQDDALLARAGATLDLTLEQAEGTPVQFTYAVPNANQCASCHTPDFSSKTLAPIGLKARHLNHLFPYGDGPENQLGHLTRIGYLTGAPPAAQAPNAADWRDGNAPLQDRARAYLDINCGHCHSATGLARTTGLHLDWGTSDPRRLGLCKPPTAAGPGTGGRSFDIVPGRPGESIMPFRLASTTPGIRMPELGRSLAHAEGTALIRQWIEAWTGQCELSESQ
jgi:uncharacterized repeat protein (TIGR03806 family)